MEPLFRKAVIGIEKTASNVRLEADPDEWPIEIHRELFKQLPWLQGLETDVELQQVDPSRGYAVGRVLIYPPETGREVAVTKKKVVALPLIIREKELLPLDVYIHDGKTFPLNEDRVKEIMFQPSAFGGAGQKSSERSPDLSKKLDPPTGTERTSPASFTAKHASAGMLHSLAPHFRAKDVEDFRARLEGDAPLRHAYLNAPNLSAAQTVVLSSKEKTASDLQELRQGSTVPSATQISYLGGVRFQVKHAHHMAYAPEIQETTIHALRQQLPAGDLKRLQEEGTLLYVRDPVVKTAQTVKQASAADTFAAYRVWCGGEARDGLVIPKMILLTGETMDSALFAGEKGYACQEKVAGVRLGNVILPDQVPQGTGVFVYARGNQAIATEPLTICSKVSVEHGTEKVASYLAQRATGETVTLLITPGLAKVAQTEDHEYLIPDTMRWLPLRGKMTRVSEDPQFVTLAQAHEKLANGAVEVCSDGHVFTLRSRGESLPFPEMGTREETQFHLGVLGLTQDQANEVIKCAAAEGMVTLPQTRPVVEAVKAKLQYMNKAASALRHAPRMPKVDLTREIAVLCLEKNASAIPDKETVDAVLSLNFVTPENAGYYISYLPELEKVSSKLAEILVASRLGFDQVRESAAKNAMTQVDSVIGGLRNLQAQVG